MTASWWGGSAEGMCWFALWISAVWIVGQKAREKRHVLPDCNPHFCHGHGVIVSEKIHKTKVALFGAALTLVTKVLLQHEAQQSIDRGVDWNVIFLLISMMIIVNIMTKTGVFQFVAIKAAKLGKGNPYTIMTIFAVVTALASALLDKISFVATMNQILISMSGKVLGATDVATLQNATMLPV